MMRDALKMSAVCNAQGDRTCCLLSGLRLLLGDLPFAISTNPCPIANHRKQKHRNEQPEHPRAAAYFVNYVQHRGTPFRFVALDRRIAGQKKESEHRRTHQGTQRCKGDLPIATGPA